MKTKKPKSPHPFLSGIFEMFGVRNVLPPLPVSLIIEPTNACNLHCPTCPTGSGKANRPKRMMSLAEFKGIIDQVKGNVTKIWLWNYGEPFLNRELTDMIKYVVSSGIYVTTSTNGEFFTSREFCMEVVKSGLQHLIICLDGADQETLSKFRKGSDFSKIMEGFRLIREAKEELGLETPKIELQFILLKHNVHQRSYMKQYAKHLGADVYCEKTVGLDCNDPEFQKMAQELLPDDLSLSRCVNRDGKIELKGEPPNKCSRLYQSAVINSDGTVLPCCYDLYSEHVMGNVFEKSLKTIWKNDRYREFRKRIRRDRKSIPICNICPEGRHAISKKSDL